MLRPALRLALVKLSLITPAQAVSPAELRDRKDPKPAQNRATIPHVAPSLSDRNPLRSICREYHYGPSDDAGVST
jgi:hypothetical protein